MTAVTRAALARLAALAATTAAITTAISACSDTVDPCADAAGTCVAVTVSSSTVDRIDHLEIDLLYGALHDTITTQLDGATELPVAIAIRLAAAEPAPAPIALVVAGKLSGSVLGMGAASPELPPGGRAAVSIELAETATCTPDGFYCGGDKLPGDPGVLYVCNGGGVPFARGRCERECVVNPDDDDACRGVGGPCTEGGFYCGGNEVDGDPRSLYQCVGGTGKNRRACPNGCEIRPGENDACR